MLSLLFLFLLALSSVKADCSNCFGIACPPPKVCSSGQCICSTPIDYSVSNSISFTATVRDFLSTNVDFENDNPDVVSVGNVLGSNDLPVFLNNQERYNTWFQNTQGVNMWTNHILTFNRVGKIWRLEGMNYYPIDNALFGNELREHNYDFTTQFSGIVDYRGGEFFNIIYDDGILVYFNRQLALSAPGLAYNTSIELSVDSVAQRCGLVVGGSYSLHIFHMERHVWFSMFDITTDLLIHPASCSSSSCRSSSCINGVCDSVTQQCACQPGWQGTSCSIRICNPSACGNGVCNPKDGSCLCNDGWAGDACDLYTCNYHGYSSGKNKKECSCDSFYTGSDCHGCSGKPDTKHLYVCVKSGDSWGVGLYSSSDGEKELLKSGRCAPGANGLDCMCNPSKSSRQLSNGNATSTIDFYNQRLNQLQTSLIVYQNLMTSCSSALQIGVVTFIVAFAVCVKFDL